MQSLLHLVAPLGQHHQQRGEHEQAHQVQDKRFPAEPVLDKQNRPDDEQHESHDAQQFVEFRALLQERRKDAFKGRHTSGRLNGG